jgi:Grx4 family monothiol glutaredoxin
MGEVIDFTEAPPVGGKTVLLFWAPWHEASAAGGPMDQVLRALASSTSETVRFGRIQAEELPDVSDRYGVSVVPTFILLNEAGVVVERIDGGDDVSQVTQAVQRLVAASPSQGGGTGGDLVSLSPTEMLTQRLERLIRSSEVMLFMKGVPTAPRCGFSRQVVDMLQEENIPFGSFDILSDENVRQGLKTHSNWPTYPQIYAKGDLIGGLDILKEMKEEGSLKEQFGITATAEAQPSLEERLKKLINRNRVMLFMKGLPSAPRCGFSRQTVEILDSESVPYDTFDILQDEEVRQGLKSYSNWPTFPQLYVDGDLVGGLDIIQEMEEDGSLSELLKGAHGQ